jgi:hypothetical protein
MAKKNPKNKNKPFLSFLSFLSFFLLIFSLSLIFFQISKKPKEVKAVAGQLNINAVSGGVQSFNQVGIGTTNPQEKLHIHGGTLAISGSGLDGSTYQRFVLYSDTTNGLYFDAPKDSAGNRLPIQFNWRGGGTPPLYISGGASYGNVGIGTTAPNRKLVVRDNAGPPIAWGGTGAYNSNYGELTWGIGYASIYGTTGNKLYLGSNGTEGQMVISNGNVGIGTTSPAQKLQVNGNIYSLNNGSKFIQESTNANTNYSETILTSWGQGAQWAINAAYTDIGSPPSNMIYKVDPGTYNTGAGLFRFDGNGKRWEFYVAPTSTGAGNPVSFTQLSHLSNSAIWFSPNGTSSHFYINSSGNVGIGTTGPTQKLYIIDNVGVNTPSLIVQNNGARASLRLYGKSTLDTGAASANLQFYDQDTTDNAHFVFENANTGDPLAVWINGNRKLGIYAVSGTTGGLSVGSYSGTLPPSDGMIIPGNVGIGTTGPTRKLSLNSGTNVYQSFNVGGVERVIIGSEVSNRRFIVFDSVASSYRLVIDEMGNVGIGTTASGGKLHVKADSSPTTPQLILEEDAEEGARLSFINNSGSSNSWTLYGMPNATAANAIFNLYYSGFGNIMSLKGNGNVGIGTTNPVQRLDVDGHIRINTNIYGNTRTNYFLSLQNDRNLCLYDNGSAVWCTNTNVSDIRLKKNIVDMEPVLDTLNKLRVIRFNYIDSADDGTHQQHIGMIAQEVEKYYPDMVYTAPNNQKLINYGKFSALLLQGLKDQQKEIKSLKHSLDDIFLNSSDDVIIVENNLGYSIKNKNDSFITRISAFAQLVVAKIQAGLIETKKLIVDGVDIVKKLNELSAKVESQQKEIEALKEEIKKLKK